VRSALGADFVAAYLTGGVLAPGFDPAESRINLLVVARSLDEDSLERLRAAIPVTKKPPRFDPLFLSRGQIEHSLDTFPVEVAELKELHHCLAGDDFLPGLEVTPTLLRLQVERELRGKLIQMRQAYLLSAREPALLAEVLRRAASGYAALFRSLLRLHGETPPVGVTAVVSRVATVFGVDETALLGPQRVRDAAKPPTPDESLAIQRRFLAEMNRLVTAVDAMPVAAAPRLP
jgi:hypothetical protein